MIITVRDMAEKALADIRSKPKGGVYASRRGIVAGSPDGCGAIIFRRTDGRVRLEVRGKHGGWQEFDLPADLEERAGKMLDDL